jgi:hypothetical protein
MTDTEKRPSTLQEIMNLLQDRYASLSKWADEQPTNNEMENIGLMAFVAHHRTELVAAALYNALELLIAKESK